MKFSVVQNVGISILILFLAISVFPQQLGAQLTARVSRAGAFAVTPPLRDLKPSRPQPGPSREIPLRTLPLRAMPNVLEEERDAALQKEFRGAPMPGAPIITSFEGQSDDDNQAVIGFRVVPPDTNGDIGPNHYVQWINLVFSVYDRAGTQLLGPIAGNRLFTGLGGPCETQNSGDPIVLYDPLADRWMASQFALPPNGQGWECIAVSQTPDPTGAWFAYGFKISNNELNDYPKLGVWEDGYYASFNMFNSFTFAFTGVVVAAFERDKMRVGDPTAQMVSFRLPPTSNSMLPADLDGSAPPLGTPNPFVELQFPESGFPQDALGVSEFAVDWVTPANSTFTLVATLPTTPFDPVLCGTSFGNNCIPQKGTSQKLDAISDRLMHRLQFRDFGTHQTLVTNHTVDVSSNLAGIRWYELRNSGSGWSLFQQGTYSPGGTIHAWMGSVAMSGNGTILLGFSGSSSTRFPFIGITGRAASDPLGTLRKGMVAFEGTGSQTGASRWGDYSMMAVDPTDDRTFWYTQEYYQTTGSFDFNTRILSIQIGGAAPISAAPGVTPQVKISPETRLNAGVPMEVGVIPAETRLLGNHPNPFNPETWLSYQLAHPAPVSIQIYDARGHHIRILDLGLQVPGVYWDKSRAAHWDGRNQQGEMVPGGLYFYTFKAGEFQTTGKMVIVK